jgi:NitT/TauT family transport system substrate-binding protein
LPKLLAVIIACLTLSCRTDKPHSPGDRITITVGGRAALVYAPITLAESLGHFKQENLNVAIADSSGGSRALTGLLGGSAQVVCGFYDHTIQMAAEGRDLKSFVVLSTSYAEAIAVSPKSSRRIEKLEDLKGATIGVTAPGSSTHFFLNYVLGQRGIGTGDFTVIGTGNAASRTAALEQGKVDAAVVLEPSISQLSLRNPGLKILADTRTPEGSRQVLGSDYYPSAVLYGTQEWLAQNPVAARALARAMKKTLEWIAAHSPEEFAQAMPASLKIDDHEAYVEAIRQTKGIFSRDGQMPQSGAEAVLRVMKAAHEKVRASKIDLSRTYTNGFVSSQ